MPITASFHATRKNRVALARSFAVRGKYTPLLVSVALAILAALTVAVAVWQTVQSGIFPVWTAILFPVLVFFPILAYIILPRCNARALSGVDGVRFAYTFDENGMTVAADGDEITLPLTAVERLVLAREHLLLYTGLSVGFAVELSTLSAPLADLLPLFAKDCTRATKMDLPPALCLPVHMRHHLGISPFEASFTPSYDSLLPFSSAMAKATKESEAPAEPLRYRLEEHRLVRLTERGDAAPVSYYSLSTAIDTERYLYLVDKGGRLIPLDKTTAAEDSFLRLQGKLRELLGPAYRTKK